MGVSFYWRPRSTYGTHLPIGPRSEFVTKMVEEFGSYPWRLRASDLPAFRRVCDAMESMSVDQAYEVLKHGIEQFLEVEVEAVY